ncbi:MAG TPA: response regulator [Burkholderiales bacterium]|nr:response regulator [Burkholderiales bacterium]
MDKKVLVVDDTRVSAELAHAILSHVGVPADIARSGEEALTWLSQNEAALILSDWRMPGMNGQQLATKIRERYPQGKPPWLIAYTAYAEEDERVQIMAAGFDAVIQKPVRPDFLARTVKDWLQR